MKIILAKNSKFNEIFRSQILIHLLLYLILAYSALTENNLLANISSMLIIIYFIFSKPIMHFYFFIGFAPFESIAKIGIYDAYFIFLIISIIKMLASDIKNTKYSLKIALAFICLLSIEVMGDLGQIPLARLMIVVVILFYVYFFVQSKDLVFFDINTVLQTFTISYFIVITQTILSYGSFENFVQLINTSAEITRLGEDDKALGGAMGIPLYSSMLLTLILSKYIANNKLRISEKSLLTFICFVTIIFGLLTISRSFILCLLATAFFLIIFLFSKNKSKSLYVLFIAIGSCFSLYLIFYDFFDNIINYYSIRNAADSGMGIRGTIYDSCFAYLDQYPFGYLIGFGIKNYVLIGIQNNLLFSYMAHNLYLDVIMSVGIIGGIAFFCILNYLRIRTINIFSNEKNIITISYMPLFVLCVFAFTALSLNNFKTYVYFLLAVVFIGANDSAKNKCNE